MNNSNNYNFDELNKFIQDNYDANKLKRKKKEKVVIILANIISIICLLIGGIGLKSIYDYKKDLEENKLLQTKLDSYYAELKKKKKEEEEKKVTEPEVEENPIIAPNVDFEALINTNPETIGWLTVKNTGVNLPIVQTSNNEYYLTHNFENNWNSLGWAFADYRNNFPDLDQNTIFYGHTYKNTIIFSTLTETLKDSWLNNDDNLIIEFSTVRELLKWQIFSIYTLPKTDDYLKTAFSEQEFTDYINLIKSRSRRNFDVDISYGDKIITLSTCYIDSDHRLVIHAKLLKG